MNRRSFIKTGLAGAILLESPLSTFSQKEFTFDEIFTVWPLNKRLIHPIPDSEFYKKIESILGDKLQDKTYGSYLGIRNLLIPFKEKYTWKDLSPLINWFREAAYSNWTFSKYGELNPVIFRMIHDNPDSPYMHLDVYCHKWGQFDEARFNKARIL